VNTIANPHQEQDLDRLGHRITARLSSGLDDLPYDISERLRASRMQALAKRKIIQAAPERKTAASILHNGATAVMGRGSKEFNGWWSVLVSALPVLLLAVGLVAINIALDEDGINEVAELDAALLTDDLPPEAYADPGFVQFLKTSAQDL